MPSDAAKYIPFLDPNREAGQFKSEDIGTDTLLAVDIAAGAVGTSELANEAVTTGKLAAGAVKKAKFGYETASLVFGATDTISTATITANSIVIGQYVSAVTGTPAASHCQLSINGTTLTGTLTSAPGTESSLTVTAVLLKA